MAVPTRRRLGSAALFGFSAATLVTLVGCGAATEESESDNSKSGDPASLADAKDAKTTPPNVDDTSAEPTPSGAQPGAESSAQADTEPSAEPDTVEEPAATSNDGEVHLDSDAGIMPPVDDIRNPVSIYRAPPSD